MTIVGYRSLRGSVIVYTVSGGVFLASKRVVWRAKLVRVHAQNARHSKTKVVEIDRRG
jgi:hypothetical protein